MQYLSFLPAFTPTTDRLGRLNTGVLPGQADLSLFPRVVCIVPLHRFIVRPLLRPERMIVSCRWVSPTNVSMCSPGFPLTLVRSTADKRWHALFLPQYRPAQVDTYQQPEQFLGCRQLRMRSLPNTVSNGVCRSSPKEVDGTNATRSRRNASEWLSDAQRC